MSQLVDEALALFEDEFEADCARVLAAAGTTEKLAKKWGYLRKWDEPDDDEFTDKTSFPLAGKGSSEGDDDEEWYEVHNAKLRGEEVVGGELPLQRRTVRMDRIKAMQPRVSPEIVTHAYQQFMGQAQGGAHELPTLAKYGDYYYILDGHHRLEARKRMGRNKVQVEYYDLTPYSDVNKLAKGAIRFDAEWMQQDGLTLWLRVFDGTHEAGALVAHRLDTQDDGSDFVVSSVALQPADQGHGLGRRLYCEAARILREEKGVKLLTSGDYTDQGQGFVNHLREAGDMDENDTIKMAKGAPKWVFHAESNNADGPDSRDNLFDWRKAKEGADGPDTAGVISFPDRVVHVGSDHYTEMGEHEEVEKAARKAGYALSGKYGVKVSFFSGVGGAPVVWIGSPVSSRLPLTKGHVALALQILQQSDLPLATLVTVPVFQMERVPLADARAVLEHSEDTLKLAKGAPAIHFHSDNDSWGPTSIDSMFGETAFNSPAAILNLATNQVHVRSWANSHAQLINAVQEAGERVPGSVHMVMETDDDGQPMIEILGARTEHSYVSLSAGYVRQTARVLLASGIPESTKVSVADMGISGVPLKDLALAAGYDGTGKMAKTAGDDMQKSITVIPLRLTYDTVELPAGWNMYEFEEARDQLQAWLGYPVKITIGGSILRGDVNGPNVGHIELRRNKLAAVINSAYLPPITPITTPEPVEHANDAGDQQIFMAAMARLRKTDSPLPEGVKPSMPGVITDVKRVLTKAGIDLTPKYRSDYVMADVGNIRVGSTTSRTGPRVTGSAIRGGVQISVDGLSVEDLRKARAALQERGYVTGDYAGSGNWLQFAVLIPAQPSGMAPEVEQKIKELQERIPWPVKGRIGTFLEQPTRQTINNIWNMADRKGTTTLWEPDEKAALRELRSLLGDWSPTKKLAKGDDAMQQAIAVANAWAKKYWEHGILVDQDDIVPVRLFINSPNQQTLNAAKKSLRSTLADMRYLTEEDNEPGEPSLKESVSEMRAVLNALNLLPDNQLHKAADQVSMGWQLLRGKDWIRHYSDEEYALVGPTPGAERDSWQVRFYESGSIKSKRDNIAGEKYAKEWADNCAQGDCEQPEPMNFNATLADARAGRESDRAIKVAKNFRWEKQANGNYLARYDKDTHAIVSPVQRMGQKVGWRASIFGPADVNHEKGAPLQNKGGFKTEDEAMAFADEWVATSAAPSFVRFLQPDDLLTKLDASEFINDVAWHDARQYSQLVTAQGGVTDVAKREGGLLVTLRWEDLRVRSQHSLTFVKRQDLARMKVGRIFSAHHQAPAPIIIQQAPDGLNNGEHTCQARINVEYIESVSAERVDGPYTMDISYVIRGGHVTEIRPYDPRKLALDLDASVVYLVDWPSAYSLESALVQHKAALGMPATDDKE